MQGDALQPTSIAEYVERFSTANLPPDVLTPQNEVPDPVHHYPLPKYAPYRFANSAFAQQLSGEQRHDFLSRPYNTNIFDGSVDSNRELRGQMIATQTHRCNSYCSGGRSSYRFYFPFPPQPRASIASRTNDPTDPRSIALAPRRSPHINSTHPMLTAMCHANTDVTIVTGSSIPESMYVCSYAVKADKNPLFNIETLKKLKRIENGSDDRKLLGSIARNSTSVQTVGAQEAVDHLLDNPIVLCSADVRNINTSFLLQYPSALSPEQAIKIREEENSTAKLGTVADILPQVDSDDTVAVVSAKAHHRRKRNSSHGGMFFEQYMARPVSLETLSPTQFHEEFVVRKLREGRVNYDENMLLTNTLREANSSASVRSYGTKQQPLIVERRKLIRNRPHVSHILNVPSRGPANDESPRFAAAALSLHVPFRTIEGLLHESTLTDRLQSLLGSNKYPSLNAYVRNCHELSTALFSKPQNQRTNPTSNSVLAEGNGTEDDTPDSVIPDDEVVDVNPLVGLTPLIAAQGLANPFACQRQWLNSVTDSMTAKLQVETFNKYIKDCRASGVVCANTKLLSEELNDEFLQRSQSDPAVNTEGDINTENLERLPEPARIQSDPLEILQIKKHILSLARSDDQRVWLDSVMCYLLVYYGLTPSTVPPTLVELCRNNHPIFTNARVAREESVRNLHQDQFEPYNVQRCSELHTSDNMKQGRLGCVAVLAPSGVAAGNSEGFTFHNGLRTYQISQQQIEDGPTNEVLLQLVQDFSHVSLLVVDEYSMAALICLLYLDLVARRVRPAFCNVPFGGIPIIITGDGLQLPVVNGQGILTKAHSVPAWLQQIQHYFTHGAFCLKLTQSVRQESDRTYGDLLLRMREARSTDDDVSLLNTRYFKDFEQLCADSPEWYTAPILTAKNSTVDALNNAASSRNGSKLGTFHVHSIPLLSHTRTAESRRNFARRFFSRRNLTSISRNGSSFTPPPILVVYPGMPVMLRTNICPGIGLFNGSLGQVLAVIQNYETLPPHELQESAMERCTLGKASVPSLLITFPNTYRGAIGAMRPLPVYHAKDPANYTVIVEPKTFDTVKGLPLVPAHAMPIHKSQSLTLPYSIIDPRETHCEGGLYVAFSRSPALDRIAIIAPVTLKILHKYGNKTRKVMQFIEDIAARSNSLEPFRQFVDVTFSALLSTTNL